MPIAYRSSRLLVAAALLGVLAAGPAVSAVPQSSSPSSSSPALAPAAQPGFIANVGQLGGEVRYYARTPDCAAYFGPRSVMFDKAPSAGHDRGVAVRVSFPNGGGRTRVEAAVPGSAVYNDFRGSDPSQWRADIATFGEVRYHSIAPGADLVYRMADGRLKYDCVLEPGVPPSRAVLRYEGADRLEVASDGGLLIHTGAGMLYEQPPYLYQDVAGVRVPVNGGYSIRGRRDLSFWAEGFDTSRPLVVDPGLKWSTYIGGGDVDYGHGVASDASGNVFVTGSTVSTNMPGSPGAYQPVKAAGYDAYVAKFKPDGTTLMWCTLLGGSGTDYGQRAAVDNSGNVYVIGYTGSTNFPVTGGAYKRTFAGGTYDAFVAKVSSGGNSLVYSTYLGGTKDDVALGIAVDGSGNAYVGGWTGSGDFGTTPGVVVPTYSPSFQDISNGFVVKLNPQGSGAAYSTYIGASQGDDAVQGIAVDGTGRVAVTGYTVSPGFPVTAGAYDASYALNKDAFVTVLNATATGYVFSSFLGSTGNDEGKGVAWDGSNVVAVGGTSSTDFPLTSGAFQRTINGTSDGWVTKFAPDGRSLVFSTALGGGSSDACEGVAVSLDGTICVTGITLSSNFPTTRGALQTASGGGYDGFAMALASNGGSLIYSTYLGGAGTDWGRAIAIRGSGDVVVSGYTDSAAFPTSSGAYDRSANGTYDAFATALDLGLSGSTAGVFDHPGSLDLAPPVASPNPFRGTTTLAMTFAQPARASVRIHDMQGRVVRSFPAEDFAAGVQRLSWDGRDDKGLDLSPGRYYVEVATDSGRGVTAVTRLR